ncbi:hypothetical protein KUTeg_018280 [Tegillarca granosa]|uniref:Uncharacterized protein n=1 Tax=Tegillarca granosa TaxID=220873 RepID=A0ABQ9ELB9_TEGGR|nr:hypothetical protein KUTeg_018280 [Tegillarca granosa]
MEGFAVYTLLLTFICTLFNQALNMEYFSNKPAPTPGPQLPQPGSNKIITKEKEERANLDKIPFMYSINKRLTTLSHSRVYDSPTSLQGPEFHSLLLTSSTPVTELGEK